MKTSLPDIRDIVVPREGQALHDAFANLDDQLAAFTSAMQAMEALLKQMAQPQDAAGETAPRGRSKGRTAKASYAQEAVEPEAPAPTQETQPDRQEARPEVPDDAVQESRPRPEDLPVKPSTAKQAPSTDTPATQTPQAQDVLPKTPTLQAPPQESPLQEPASAAPSEDEVLLASLDEATVKAIKVMRRLEPNKSVKELLKRIEERKDQPVQAAKPAGRSWFKRR